MCVLCGVVWCDFLEGFLGRIARVWRGSRSCERKLFRSESARGDKDYGKGGNREVEVVNKRREFTMFIFNFFPVRGVVRSAMVPRGFDFRWTPGVWRG